MNTQTPIMSAILQQHGPFMLSDIRNTLQHNGIHFDEEDLLSTLNTMVCTGVLKLDTSFKYTYQAGAPPYKYAPTHSFVD